MNKKEARQKEITTIIQENGSISNSRILSILGDEIERTTLQRDLKELLEGSVISRSGSGAGTVYDITPTNKMFMPINVEEYFDIPQDDREIQGQFNWDIFDMLENSVFSSEDSNHLNDLQNQFRSNYQQYKSQTLINKELERIMIEFAWKSSEIEGNTYSFLATEALLKNNVVAKGKSKEDTQMILNHKDAFNESIQNKEVFRSVSRASIEHVHSVITKDLDIQPGIRSEGVGIGGTNYKPLSNSHQINEAMEKMISLIVNKESVFEKAFLSQLLISYIQIFADGNKRTARMTSNAILLAHDFIPLSYRAVDVVEYKKAILLFYEQNNFSYFKKIFIEQYAFAVKNYFN